MATITVTRSLPSLVGVFNVNTFEFTITEDVIPTVTIAGVAFMPVKTGNAYGVDTYVMDVTDILKYVFGLPNIDTKIVTNLSVSCPIAISGAGATTVNIVRPLVFSVNKIGLDSITTVYTYGRSEIVYHHGEISFYNNSAVTGLTACTIGGINKNYLIIEGWNLITLDAAHLINGTFTVAGTDISISVVYLPIPSSTTSIDWINRDGCWSKTYLRKLGESYSVEKSNNIPVYNLQQSLVWATNRNISASKMVDLNFDIVAKNTDHYKMLCEISDSPFVLIGGNILGTIINISQDIAECRQNLHFVLTLQYQDYVANY